METISVKFEDKFAREIDKIIKKNRYTTKAEFIREAIREKIKKLENKILIEKIRKIYGTSKNKTTDEELHKAGEKAFEELEKELNSQ